MWTSVKGFDKYEVNELGEIRNIKHAYDNKLKQPAWKGWKSNLGGL